MRRLVASSIRFIPYGIRETVKNWPAIGPLQRKLTSMLLDGREFLHMVDRGPAEGLVFPVMLPQDKGIWTGTYEAQFARALADALRPGDVCYDIGGWRGFFSGVMALAGAARVSVFEPLPENAATIRRVISLNPALPIELIEAAVGEQRGKLEFCVMPETSMGKLATSAFQKNAKESQRIMVELVAIDDLVAANRIALPQLIKIDVEGAEAMVLEGARATLAVARPTLFIEVHSRELLGECTALLSSLGYEVTCLETGRAPDPGGEFEICHLKAARVPLSTAGVLA